MFVCVCVCVCVCGNISKRVCATISIQKDYCLYFELGTVMCRTQKT